MISFGIFKPGPLGTSIRGTSRYVASPSYSAPLVLWRGKGTTGRGMQQFMPSQCAVPTAGASRQSSTQGNTELSRLPMGTRGKQHSCKHSSLWDHRNYTGRDAAAASSPLPSSSLSCPFYLNSLCKVISVNQSVAFCLVCAGKMPSFLCMLSNQESDNKPQESGPVRTDSTFLHACSDSQHLQRSSRSSQARFNAGKLLFSPCYELFSLH